MQVKYQLKERNSTTFYIKSYAFYASSNWCKINVIVVRLKKTNKNNYNFIQVK